MKQKKERTIKNTASRSQDGEGVQEIHEQDLEQVTGGYAVTQAQASAMAAQRGPVVASGHSPLGLPWERFANGQTIAGSEL